MDLKAPLDPLAYARSAGAGGGFGSRAAFRGFFEKKRPGPRVSFHHPAGLARPGRVGGHGRGPVRRPGLDLAGHELWTTPGTQEALPASPKTYTSNELAHLQANLADPICRPA